MITYYVYWERNNNFQSAIVNADNFEQLKQILDESTVVSENWNYYIVDGTMRGFEIINNQHTLLMHENFTEEDGEDFNSTKVWTREPLQSEYIMTVIPAKVNKPLPRADNFFNLKQKR